MRRQTDRLAAVSRFATLNGESRERWLRILDLDSEQQKNEFEIVCSLPIRLKIRIRIRGSH